MDTLIRSARLPLLLTALCAPASAQQLVMPEPLGEPATTVYRQVLPDGSVVYSDKAVRGAKVDQTLNVEPSPRGSTWSVEGNARPVAARVAEPTPVKQVATIPPLGRPKSEEEAAAEVIRAEMLLEDARRRRDQNHAPRPEELGDTGSDSDYARRQKALAAAVSEAQMGLERARAERDAARRAR
ncbi:MAG TPA: hypothetical protein VIG66_06730 [Noviherbaspirillum sp.]